jgi:hypothetical protein
MTTEQKLLDMLGFKEDKAVPLMRINMTKLVATVFKIPNLKAGQLLKAGAVYIDGRQIKDPNIFLEIKEIEAQ